MDLSADVFAPLLNVDHHLAVYGGGIEGVDITGQHEFAGLATPFQREDSERRNRPLLCPLVESLVVPMTPGISALDKLNCYLRPEQQRPSRFDRLALVPIRLGVNLRAVRLGGRGWNVWRRRGLRVRFGLILAHTGLASAGKCGACSLTWLGRRS